MSELIYPRSPKEQMDGWSYLPRFLDKVRLHLAGQLHADYQPTFAHKGFDAAWLEAAGLKAEDFIAAVSGTITDGQVCDWVRQNVKTSAADKAKFNAYLLNRGREENDPAIRERLKQRKAESGLGHRDDIQTFVDFIDADEKRH
jgi:gluconokinase